MAVAYTPIVLTGDYDARQKRANQLDAIAYYEEHMNSYALDAPHYGLVEVASNASAKSKEWAADLAARWQAVTGLPTRMRQIAKGGRGDYNIRLTDMPACLGEPGPINHAEFDKWMESDTNREALALAVAQSIRSQFPAGGIIALSHGHIGKTSSPGDTGAADSDPDNEPDSQTEGWFNVDVIYRIKRMLSEGVAPTTPPPAPVPTPAPAPLPSAPPFPGRNFHARMDKRGRFVAAIRYGEAFKPWQRRMAARGWDIGAADGVFGPKCYRVCRAFQAEKGLGVDGIVGGNTWAAAWSAPVTR